jgi:hypothetical protein
MKNYNTHDGHPIYPFIVSLGIGLIIVAVGYATYIHFGW